MAIVMRKEKLKMRHSRGKAVSLGRSHVLLFDWDEESVNVT